LSTTEYILLLHYSVHMLTTEIATMASTERRTPASSMCQEHEALQNKDPSIFPIMQLPIEVRQKIWKSVMVYDEPIPVEPHGRFLSAPSHLRSGKQVKIHVIEQEQQRLSSQFALASTCRQIYLEVAPIYYGMNTFTFTFTYETKYLIPFFRAIGTQNARSLTSIRWPLFELRIRFLPTLSLYLDDRRLPGVRSLRDCLETLSEERRRAPFHTSEFKEIVTSHPWLAKNIEEHREQACCVCCMDMQVEVKELLSKSNTSTQPCNSCT